MTLVYVAGVWLLGIVTAAFDGVFVAPCAVAIAIGGLAIGARRRRVRYALLGLLAAALFLAAGARYEHAQPGTTPSGVAAYNDGATVRFRALVSDEPEVRGRSQRTRLDVREVLIDGEWRPTSGGVQMRSPLFPRHRYGDVLEIEGDLKTPPSFPDFDYRDYLAQRGMGSLIDYPSAHTIARGEGNAALEALYATRSRLGGVLERSLTEPQAALAQGILLGQRSAIPSDVTADMNATGTSHLVAISGQNVSLVAAFVIAALAWLIGRRQAAVVALFAIAGYTALTGASPSVVRAAIMGGLFVIATLAGRPASASTAIALSAAAMTVWDPNVVRDVSFQLSFASILGLVYLSPGLQERGAALLRRLGVTPEGIAAALLESTAVTLGATAATLPLIALQFGRVSVVAPLANLFAVPAFPIILLSSGVTALLGTIWAPLATPASWVAWASLTYLIETARYFASLPLASFQIAGFGRAHAALAYVALAWLARRFAQHKPQDDIEQAAGGRLIQPAWAIAGALVIGVTLVWWAALSPASDGRLSVTVLDVGQGDAILIESPDEHRALIDGGPDARRLDAALSNELPFWDRRIDLVALTHAQEDHLTGLVDALERYDVGEVLASPEGSNTGLYREWRARIAEQEIPYHEGQPGQRIDLGGGATLEVLGPGTAALASSNINNSSLVLRIEWRGVSFLLTGDMETAAETALVASGEDVRATVLKVAHHGSLTSTSPSFLLAVHPEAAVVSVGRNSFGQPEAAVLERLRNVPVLRTDLEGTVRFSTDGERLWVKTER